MTPNRPRPRVPRAETAAAVLAGPLLAAGGAAEASAAPFPDGVRAGTPTDTRNAVKYYVVGTEPDGKPEFLYSIAEKVLGDGSRFDEILRAPAPGRQPRTARKAGPPLQP
ncbi:MULTISPECIES: hypothetical protein [Streptomyces]|uniref:Uncharacterized protein n=2 Tax=Streptomyces TaxID=1883 RepID=A0ABV9IPW8_9ACTN